MNTTTNEQKTEMKKHYYIALFDTQTNEVRLVPNTPKGRNTLQKFKNENCKAFRVGASTIEEAYEVFKNETNTEPTLVKIVYKKNIPVCKEIEI